MTAIILAVTFIVCLVVLGVALENDLDRMGQRRDETLPK